jgi:hypothetical protein
VPLCLSWCSPTCALQVSQCVVGAVDLLVGASHVEMMMTDPGRKPARWKVDDFAELDGVLVLSEFNQGHHAVHLEVGGSETEPEGLQVVR